MDIQTKDGILLRGIPDGTPDEAIKARIAKIRAEGGGKPVAPAPKGERLENAEFSDTGKFTPSGEKAIALAGIAAPELPMSDFATGASGLMRGLLNLPGKAMDAVRGKTLSDVVAPNAKKEGLGDRAFPKSTNEGAAKFVGELADPLAWTIGGGVMKALPYAKVGGQGVVEAIKALVKNATGGAITGGTIGALSEEGDAATGAGVGAAASVVLPPAIGGVAKALSAAKNAIRPSPGAIGVMAAGDKSDDVINALMQTRSNVPGVNLTAGQASVPANSAEFAALQRLVAEGKAPSDYFGPAGIEGQQQAARRASVQTVGKTPSDLAAAVAARKTASEANYGAAYQQAIKADPALMKMHDNPYFKDALPDAIKLAEANGINPKNNLTEFLHFVKVSLDKQLLKSGDTALGATEKSAVKDLQKNLVGWLGAKNPAYDAARTEHIARSKPINQMKLGQEIEQALVAPGTEAERAGVFANAVRGAENKVSKTTGRPRIEDLTPTQRRVFDAIEEDLKRNSEYAGLASKGSTNLENRIGAPEVPPTGWFQPMVSAARGWTNRALGTGHENALKRLAPLMKDPQAMASTMRNATPQQQAVMQSLLSQYLTRAVTIGAAKQGE